VKRVDLWKKPSSNNAKNKMYFRHLMTYTIRDMLATAITYAGLADDQIDHVARAEM
jgi:predicted naringenin-chalcone synthase